MELNEFWGFLIEECIATEEELQLVTNINGYNYKALNDVLEVRTGYRNIAQYKEEVYGDE